MNIVIIGGGTAGWLSAYVLSQLNPDFKVTVIESSSVGIIGTGEGSTGFLVSFLQALGNKFHLTEKQILNRIDGTVKYGIKHINWSRTSDYYFAPITGNFDLSLNNDHIDNVTAYCVKNLKKEKRHLSTELGFLMEHNKLNLSDVNGQRAYHFDGHKIGSLLKEILGKSVNLIDDTINEVTLESLTGNISYLTLSDGTHVSGDFFIDASGFNRILSKKVNNKWISFSKYLPLNAAIPFHIEHDNFLPSYTEAKAMKYGWQWKIPTQSRMGCGYVFDENLISFDEALFELEKDHKRKINPIKQIRFDSGRIDKFLYKNYLSIGLSGSFLEPLEATSIHFTLCQLDYIGIIFGNNIDYNDQKKVAEYNNVCEYIINNFRDFVQFHYLGKRCDTAFWRNFLNGNVEVLETVSVIENMLKHDILDYNYFTKLFGVAGWELWSQNAMGLDLISEDVASYNIRKKFFADDHSFIFNSIIENIKNKTKSFPDNTLDAYY